MAEANRHFFGAMTVLQQIVYEHLSFFTKLSAKENSDLVLTWHKLGCMGMPQPTQIMYWSLQRNAKKMGLHVSDRTRMWPGANFMDLLTVSTESALTEAGNYVLTASVFHGLAADFGFCACVLRVTRHSKLTRLAQKFRRLHVSGESWS